MFRKNTASQFIHFQGVDATTGGIKSGVTWTIRRCIDGTFAAATGTVTEDGTTGWYKLAMSQADTNGNNIGFNFTGTGAVPQTVNIVTTAADPTNATTFGLANLDAAISTRMATFTPLTAAQIATGVWQDATAGDFTVASSIGKSVMNGVSLGTGLTVNALTTNNDKTGYGLSAAAISAIWQDTTAGDFTAANSIGKSIMNGVSLGTGLTINAYTGNTVQTGDAYAKVSALTYTVANQVDVNVVDWKGSAAPAMTGDAFARLGAPAGASTAADIAAVKVDTAAVKVQTDKLTFTVANQVDANMLSTNGDATAAANVAKTTRAIVRCTASGVPTTTSIPTSACTPVGVDADQFKGKIITFDANTATTALRGQSTDITASSAAAAPTFTVTALTSAPVSGDTFSIT